MKKFVVRLLVFVSIFTIMIVTTIGGTICIISKASFKIPVDKNILVIGDSHTECAIDDRIYSRSVNVSKGGTAYLYSYCKLRKFLNENSHIDTVLLAYGRLNRKAKFLSQLLPYYFTLMDGEDFAVYTDRKALINAVFDIPIRNIGTILKFIAGRKVSYQDLNIGAYLRHDQEKLQEDIARFKEETAGDDTVSSCQRDYLLKIIDLCKAKGVELILIRTPTFKPEIYRRTSKEDEFYSTYLQGVMYLDYSGFPLPDSHYADITHLNYKGAEVFSTYLQGHLSGDLAWEQSLQDGGK
jgi:hypothetical protein